MKRRQGVKKSIHLLRVETPDAVGGAAVEVTKDPRRPEITIGVAAVKPMRKKPTGRNRASGYNAR